MCCSGAYSGYFFFFKQKTASEMRISDWSSDVCSSDLPAATSAAAATSRSSPSSTAWSTTASRATASSRASTRAPDRARGAPAPGSVHGRRSRDPRGRSDKRRDGKEVVRTYKSRGMQYQQQNQKHTEQE